ncbi:MAG: hypothetical protein IKR12_00535 [Clostridia bacterium]|nr:hypothetical protein [Clostridia bacterium]
MVKNKKMSKTSIAVIVLALLLVFSLVMGMTGAWFTSKAGSATDTSLDFGRVVLNVTGGSFGQVSHTNNGDAAYLDGVEVMPGDSINYSLTVAKAATSEDFYYRIFVTVTGVAGASYTADETVYDTTAEGWNGTHAGSITLAGNVYGNTYQGANISLAYEVRAIQKANITAADAAKYLASTESGYVLEWETLTGLAAA